MFDLKTKILIVDDMLTMRKLVGKVCRDIGFTTFVEAPDGQKAWDQLNADPTIGLVISDWNMPVCTGVEFLKKVRADARFGKLPFLLVTAESEARQVAEALQAGVTNYVVKPFTGEGLKAKLEQAHAVTLKKMAA